MKDMRLTIGARNPFALAELVENRRIEWKELEPGERRRILEKNCGCSYDRLFSPESESPVFGPLPDMPGGWK
ncbi:MAG: hypothetical protein APR53_02560 [Methanoculleus sp. SDB]|nr:MAG: hypothetical protein APR53_02560 [Methanoculleus sp. SDB]